MATLEASAEKRAHASDSLNASMTALSELLGVEPAVLPNRAHDPLTLQANQLEAFSIWAKQIVETAELRIAGLTAQVDGLTEQLEAAKTETQPEATESTTTGKTARKK